MHNIFALANWKVLLPLGIIFGFFTGYVFPSQQDKINVIVGSELTSLDVRWTYQFNEVVSLFELLGDNGRALYYKVSSRLDSVYILIYGTFFILLIANLLKKSSLKPSQLHGKRSWLMLLPTLAMGFDFAENLSILQLINHYPNITTQQVDIAASMTQLKWMALMSVLLLMAFLALLALKQKIQSIAN